MNKQEFIEYFLTGVFGVFVLLAGYLVLDFVYKYFRPLIISALIIIFITVSLVVLGKLLLLTLKLIVWMWRDLIDG